jgi:hypothetical protein
MNTSTAPEFETRGQEARFLAVAETMTEVIMDAAKAADMNPREAMVAATIAVAILLAADPDDEGREKGAEMLSDILRRAPAQFAAIAAEGDEFDA